MVGLGRMGANMTKRLLEHDHQVVAFDRDPQAVQASQADGAEAADNVAALCAQLSPPRAVWVMVPAGDPTTQTVLALAERLEAGDVIIDGGNSNYHHAQQMTERLRPRGIDFVDAGTSGGIWGLANGYCLMVGGAPEAVAKVEPIFLALAPDGGYAHVGPSGAGHFVKMVHNGIEYGMLQAYAEGFALLEAAEEFELDLHQVASIWRYGSVVRSWLLELAERALADRAAFERIEGWVDDSGEGRWTVEEAINRAVPAPVITTSLFERFSSRNRGEFAARMIAALRNEFGGHAVHSDPS
jgi:6-phosphogluconate dehydrogenase